MSEPHGLRRNGKPWRLIKHLACCKHARFTPVPDDAQIFDLGAMSRLVELGYVHEGTCLLTEKGAEVAARL